MLAKMEANQRRLEVKIDACLEKTEAWLRKLKATG
jgi:hypothetical protein